MQHERRCAELVKEYQKYKRVYIKSQIRKHEKIENPNVLEQYQLCQDYRSLCHVEGHNSGIYDLCKECEFLVDAEACAAMHNPDFGYEIIWGNVYKKV